MTNLICISFLFLVAIYKIRFEERTGKGRDISRTMFIDEDVHSFLDIHNTIIYPLQTLHDAN